jgi:uncharacterized membrane protein YoaK (UPF0700 family)
MASSSDTKGTSNTSNTSNSRLLGALGILTLATGVVDAASVLGLGHVFTANMTGNVVFLGFSLTGAGHVAASDCAVALAAFLLGAVVGGRLAARGGSFKAAIRLEAAVLTLAAGAAWLMGDRSSPSRLAEISLLAAGMGIQNASVRKLGVPDFTTTVLTLTLTGLAADSSLAGGANPRLSRRLGSVALMLLGGLTGALLARTGVRWPITGAALLAAGASAISPPRGATIATPAP